MGSESEVSLNAAPLDQYTAGDSFLSLTPSPTDILVLTLTIRATLKTCGIQNVLSSSC